jgi:hypothetical protein
LIKNAADIKDTRRSVYEETIDAPLVHGEVKPNFATIESKTPKPLL